MKKKTKRGSYNKKSSKVYYPGEEENNINEDGGEQIMENEAAIQEETVLVDENDEFVSNTDLKNFEDFEADFHKGVSYFEIYQKDFYNSKLVFREKLFERPEDGWQAYIQKKFVDTSERPQQTNWVVHLKNAISRTSGNKYPKKSSPVFAVSPSPEIMEQIKVLRAMGGANSLIYQNNPAPPQAPVEKDRFTVMAEAQVAKTMEKMMSETGKPETKESLIDQIKALKEAISVLTPAQTVKAEEPKATFKETFNDNISMIKSLAEISGGNKKDNTEGFYETLLAMQKEQSAERARHEREMAELRIEQIRNENSNNDIFGKIDRLEDLETLMERMGYSKGDGSVKESPWIPVVKELAVQAMPVLTSAFGLIGAMLTKPKQPAANPMLPNYNQSTGPAGYDPNLQIPQQNQQNVNFTPNQNIAREVQQPAIQPVQSVPNVDNAKVVELQKYAKQIEEMGFDDLSIMGFLNAIKISYFHKLDMLEKKLEETEMDDLSIVYDGIIDALEIVPVINDKLSSITTHRELEDYVHNIFVTLANNPVAQRFLKISDTLASPQGQMWLVKLEKYISYIYFAEEHNMLTIRLTILIR